MRFSRILTFVGLAVLLSCQQSDYRDVADYSIEQFMNTKTIFGSSFSYDESMVLYSSNETGVYNAFTVPVGGGPATQITDSKDDAVIAISFFPKDNRILYRGDKGGDEIWHIYLRNEDGSTQDLTPDEKARAVFYGWSYDEKSFFYGSNKVNPKFMDIYEMDLATLTPRMIYQNEAGTTFGAISNDKHFIALSKTITTVNTDIYLYDTDARKTTHLTPHDGDIAFQPLQFSTDSKQLLYLSDEGSEFTYLKSMDLENNKSVVLEQAEWDIAFSNLSRNGKYRVIGINNDGRTEIVVKTESGEQVHLPELPDGEITSARISKHEDLMTFYLNGSRSPNNLYLYNFTTGQSTRLTDSMNSEIVQDDLVEGQVIRYKSFDGLDIPAILYKPHQIKADEKAPALVWVHGGPGGQSRVGYNEVIQYLVNHGYVVLAVNNRGSSGYGKTFFQLDDLKHGEDDLQDCIESKSFLAATGYVDENRIGIIGGSYGGYMVLAALAFQPDAFEVGVDIFGVANWIRTLKSIPPWWEAFREALYKELGNPATDEAYLTRISPLFHADKINKPLMVLQGANDPRVLKVESDEIVAAVKQNGVPVEYMVFDDEGHGFRKNENKLKGYAAILNFLDKHLKQSASERAHQPLTSKS